MELDTVMPSQPFIWKHWQCLKQYREQYNTAYRSAPSTDSMQLAMLLQQAVPPISVDRHAHREVMEVWELLRSQGT